MVNGKMQSEKAAERMLAGFGRESGYMCKCGHIMSQCLVYTNTNSLRSI